MYKEKKKKKEQTTTTTTSTQWAKSARPNSRTNF
jgi:hypothetical protein